METIRLETFDGAFVAKVEIPPFKTYPAVVLWGDRAFGLVTVQKEGEMTAYRELFAVVALRTVE